MPYIRYCEIQLWKIRCVFFKKYAIKKEKRSKILFGAYFAGG